MKLSRCVSLLISLLAASACSSVKPVQPWERGYLSEPGMQWDAKPREAKLEGHVYTSKEASSGGNGAAGGGCGCN